ncbi:MAG: hypothetical protein J2P37_17200 [Ktedonobacteraceae bacterium]|nr:hypothetical protein [Ktedonobacteraceae bacterium]
MSNDYTAGSGSGASGNSSSYVSRKEVRASNMTGALPLLGGGAEKSHNGQFEFEQMIESLHELFEHDRQVASQSDATRCGICYLHFPVAELHYREEGLYLCPQCERTLGNQKLTVVRKQQKL